jgi:hypothetical protein
LAFVATAIPAHATLPPAYTLENGDIVANAGDETARVHVDCASPSALVVRDGELYVACGDERLTYSTSADVMRPALVDRLRTTCFDVDAHGVCQTFAVALTPVETIPGSPVPKREQRTTTGWIIVGSSLAGGVVIEGVAWVFRLLAAFCDPSASCGPRDLVTFFDVAAVVVPVAGIIAGIAVASTWHDVKPKKKRMTLLPSIVPAPGGGMIGLHVVF